MTSRRPLELWASASLLTLVLGCGGNVSPSDGASPPDRPLPTSTRSTCGTDATQPVTVVAFERVDNHTVADLRGPIGVTFSDCPASAAVRVDPAPSSTPAMTSSLVIPVDRPRSVLAWGPGYLTTRGRVFPFGTMGLGSGATVLVDVLRADEWRPRLPAAQAVTPTLVVVVGDGTMSSSVPGVPCHGAGVTMQLADDPHATITYLDAGPSRAVSAAPAASDAGIIVVGGLSAGALPHATFTAPAGCVVHDVSTISPLENGVVTLQYVALAVAP